MAEPFPVNALRTCGLRWKFSLHVLSHVTHRNILKSSLKFAELFNLSRGNFSSVFGCFHGKLGLAVTKHSSYWTLTTLLQYFVCLLHFGFERGSHSVTQIGLKLTV